MLCDMSLAGVATLLFLRPRRDYLPAPYLHGDGLDGCMR